jgi:hypothetical protein
MSATNESGQEIYSGDQFVVGYGGCGDRELAFFELNIAQDGPTKWVLTIAFNHPLVLTALLGLIMQSALSAQATDMIIICEN